MILGKKDFTESQWLNGKGKTCQLYIFPVGSSLADQNFVLRISIASLSTTLTPFSLFHHHYRYLTILEGGPVTLGNLKSGERK